MFLREPPLRCLDCTERCLLISEKENRNWYICHKSPIKDVVSAWKCCNDVKYCPLGKPNIRI